MQVFCLCAAWCTACTEYRSVFQAVRTDFPKQFGASVLFSWVDVEEQADVVDPLEPEDFPTVLIAQDGQAVFLGPLMPQRRTLERMLMHFLTAPKTPIELQTQVQMQAQALLQRLLTAGL